MTFYLSPSFLSLPFSQFLTLLKLSFLAVMMGIPVVLYFPISSTQLRSKTLRKPQNMTVCACLPGLQLQLEQQQQQHHSYTACLLTYEQETAERSVCVCVFASTGVVRNFVSLQRTRGTSANVSSKGGESELDGWGPKECSGLSC